MVRSLALSSHWLGNSVGWDGARAMGGACGHHKALVLITEVFMDLARQCACADYW
jgi:hypothetical protein